MIDSTTTNKKPNNDTNIEGQNSDGLHKQPHKNNTILAEYQTNQLLLDIWQYETNFTKNGFDLIPEEKEVSKFVRSVSPYVMYESEVLLPLYTLKADVYEIRTVTEEEIRKGLLRAYYNWKPYIDCAKDTPEFLRAYK